jgi:peptidoglycan/xylan/chitin deacetylase (PgdA/CDA1 family)
VTSRATTLAADRLPADRRSRGGSPTLTGHLRVTKALFFLAVVGVVAALLFGARWASDHRVLASIIGGPPDPYVGAQTDTPVPDLPAADLARYREFADAPVADRAPLVLSYHDIQPDPKGAYALTPERFAEHMAMLDAAGFHTITSADLHAWQRGEPLAPRSVYLTFDDGTAGLWEYADPVLERHGFTGVTFVITGDVASRTGGYYLSWAELERMHESGRWDVESHSSDGHGLVGTDADAGTGAFFVNRQYLAAQGRLETLDEFRARVAADLDEVRSALTAHDLPAPAFFAHPRSATAKDANDPATLGVLASELGARYAASFINRDFASQLRAADVQAGVFPRLELLGSDSASEAFDKLVRAVAVPVSDSAPFLRPNLWVGDDGAPVTGVAPDRLSLDPGDGTWKAAHFAPGASAAWSTYSVNVRVDGLGADGSDVSAGVTVYDGAPAEILVSVAAGSVRVRRGSGDAQTVLGEARLAAAPAHHVQTSVDRGRLQVAVDGQVVYAGDAGDPAATGGVALSVWRRDATRVVPTFTDLRIAP